MKFFIFILLLLLSTPAQARVQVFLGFMDDEVNGVLERVLENRPNAKILALTADVLSDEVKGQSSGMLFGRPISAYTSITGQGLPASFSGPTSPLKAKSGSPGLRLYNSIHTLTQTSEFHEKLQQASSNEAPRRTALNGIFVPQLSVLDFSQSDSASDLIIVVRSPEMGRQPNLVNAYLSPIFRAIQNLSEADPENGGIKLSVFGTSGGINPNFKPGFLAPVEASIYVGVEIDPDVHAAKRNRGIVSWTGKNQSSPTVYFNEAFSTRLEAESAARAAFISTVFDDQFPLNSKGPKFREAVESETRKRIAASLTTSFFAGPDVKERGNELGLVTVDMEDSQILELTRTLNIPFEVKRLITDPAHIPDSAREAIARWSRSSDYGSEDYVQAILWGLQGGHLGELEKNQTLRRAASWKLFDEPEMLEHRHLVSSLDIHGEQIILDPIYAEIAAEFLKDAANASLLSTSSKGTHNYDGIIYKTILEQLDTDGLSELNKLMDEKSERIAVIARRIYKESAEGSPENTLRLSIEEMISKCLSLEIQKNTALHAKISRILASEINLAPNPIDKKKAQAKNDLFQELGRIRLLGTRDARLGSEASKYRYSKWVVQTRWAGNTGRKLRYLGPEGLDPVAQDRLFYRSGLVTLTSPTIQSFVDEVLASLLKQKSEKCPHILKTVISNIK